MDTSGPATVSSGGITTGAPVALGSSAHRSQRETQKKPRNCGKWPKERSRPGPQAPQNPLQPQLAPDDLLHDLVGAASDRPQAGVAQGPLDLVLAHVAVAAVE